MFDEVLFLGLHPGLSLAAAALGAVEGDRVPLYVTGVADGDHHVLLDDGVLQGYLGGLLDDLGAPLVSELRLQIAQLTDDDIEDLRLRGKDLLETVDVLQDIVVFLDDLLPLQPGESVEPHLQDRLGLEIGEPNRWLVFTGIRRKRQIELLQPLPIGE